MLSFQSATQNDGLSLATLKLMSLERKMSGVSDSLSHNRSKIINSFQTSISDCLSGNKAKSLVAYHNQEPVGYILYEQSPTTPCSIYIAQFHTVKCISYCVGKNLLRELIVGTSNLIDLNLRAYKSAIPFYEECGLVLQPEFGSMNYMDMCEEHIEMWKRSPQNNFPKFK